MVNDTGSIVEEPFVWVQLAIHLSCTISMVLIFATLQSVPDLTSGCTWIKRYYIAPNLCIPCFEISNIKKKLKSYDQLLSINFTINWTHSKDRNYQIIPVIQEIQREEGENEAAIAICSGNGDFTFFASRESESGTSSLPCLRLESSRLVTGSNGPSSVVGMLPATTTSKHKMAKVKSTTGGAICGLTLSFPELSSCK